MAPRSVTVEQRAEWMEQLRELCRPGDTVYTVLRHRAASGMSRAIDLYAFRPDASDSSRISKRWLSYWVAAILGERFSERWEAVTVSGAGMDMGFHLVYRLASVLYPDGFECAGERCPSNDHTNGMPRYFAPGEWPKHQDGGYALRHEWL